MTKSAKWLIAWFVFWVVGWLGYVYWTSDVPTYEDLLGSMTHANVKMFGDQEICVIPYDKIEQGSLLREMLHERSGARPAVRIRGVKYRSYGYSSEGKFITDYRYRNRHGVQILLGVKRGSDEKASEVEIKITRSRN